MGHKTRNNSSKYTDDKEGCDRQRTGQDGTQKHPGTNPPRSSCDDTSPCHDATSSTPSSTTTGHPRLVAHSLARARRWGSVARAQPGDGTTSVATGDARGKEERRSPTPSRGERGGCSTAALSRTSSILSMVGARRGVDGVGAWRGGRPCDCQGVGRSGVLLWAGALGVLVGGARGWAVGPCAAARLLHPRARQCPPASLPRAGRHRHPDPLSTLPQRLARLTEKNGGASHLHLNGSRVGRTAPGGFVAPRKSCLPAAICTNGQWPGHTLQTVARFYHR